VFKRHDKATSAHAASTVANYERSPMLHLAFFHFDFVAILNAVHHFAMHTMSGMSASG